MDYVFESQGKAFTPDGRTEVNDVAAHNRELEQAEIAWLKTAPDRVFLYVKMPSGTPAWQSIARANCPGNPEIGITSWLGTVISDSCEIGPRRHIGFGFHTYRRAISCRIFGTVYHGWYFESSGSYCRLRKAKKQD